MTIRERIVRIQLDGTDAPTTEVVYTLKKVGFLTDTAMLPRTVVAEHDSIDDRKRIATLWCDDDALEAVQWRVTIGAFNRSFDLSYGDGSEVYLPSLLIGGSTPVPTTTAQSLYDDLDARIEALEAGGGGATSGSYIHTQVSAATLWTVNHNMGIYPVAQVLSNGGDVVGAHIVHVSYNQLQVHLTTANSGRVVCKG